MDRHIVWGSASLLEDNVICINIDGKVGCGSVAEVKNLLLAKKMVTLWVSEPY